MSELALGPINGHVVGWVLKEAVRRATVIIRTERTIFEANIKAGYSGNMDDVFTSADTKAQAVYMRMFEEGFSMCGVIGEEDKLRLEPKDGCTAYFTVDPLDGTKAYIRRQSHGVATMIALVDGTEVLSAYIGDINTEEVYGFRPGSSRVHRITRLDTFEELSDGAGTLKPGEFFALLRDPPDRYSEATQAFLPTLKNYEVMGSSIGTWAARLWKREVSIAIMPPGFETPWDSTPVIGISKKLGYAFLRPKQDGSGWEEYDPPLPKENTWRDHDSMIIARRDAITLGLI